MHVHVWVGDTEHELECVCMWVCAPWCVCWCPFCAPLLMHRHSGDACANGSWSCRGCIDCSDLQIIALKSDQQQPTEVGKKTKKKSFPIQQESGRSALRSNTFNCLWCSPAPTAQSPWEGKASPGPDLFLLLLASFTCRLGNVSVVLTSALLQLPDTNKMQASIETLHRSPWGK